MKVIKHIIQFFSAIHSGEDSEVDSSPCNTPSKKQTTPSKSGAVASSSSAAGNFRRKSFPRDSGCFTISGDSKHSPAASDRSSHSSSASSHPESGIAGSSHGPLSLSSASSEEDEHTLSAANGVSAVKRPAELAAKARSLRDRRTVNLDELEEATRGVPTAGAPGTRKALSHSQTMELIHAARETSEGGNKEGFDALVEKYSEKKLDFGAQFKSAKSRFEQK